MRTKIDIKYCSEVGYVKKTHGVQGELNIVLEANVSEAIEKLNYLFFQIDGLLVPFFIHKISGINTEFINAEFRNLQTKEIAQRFVGTKIFLPTKEILAEEEDFSTSILKGFTIVDINLGEIGKVTEVNDFGGNIVLTVNYQKKEVMIPFNEELVHSFDINEKMLEMDCPEGIFDLEE